MNAEKPNPTTAPAEQPDEGHRVAELLDLLLLGAADSLYVVQNRVLFADLIMGLFRRGRLVPAEKVVEIIVRAVGCSAHTAVQRIYQELEAEALAAIGRGE